MIMKDNTKLRSLSDNELLRRLSELLQNSRRVKPDTIGHIAEVDRRRLYARHSPSLFESVASSTRDRMFRRRYANCKASPNQGAAVRPTATRSRPVRPYSGAESKRTDAEVDASVKHQQASDTTPASRRVKPLSPARFKVAFTASAELCDKLERLQALMRASVTAATVARVIDAAVTEKLENFEAKRYGIAESKKEPGRDGHVSFFPQYSGSVRRAVYARDRDSVYRPCGQALHKTKQLEFHHVPALRAGQRAPARTSTSCRAHNALFAEHDCALK